ncbi:MAG: 4'-phosphopantetheinyl transferase superfamily protein [Cyanobacteria bacterium J06555_13]
MRNVVQVWQIPLDVSDDTVKGYVSCLSAAEQAKANRFRFDKDKRRYVVARGSLRHLLSNQLGLAPAEIEFCYGDYGKPFVQAPRQRSALAKESTGDLTFHFNLSHSGEMALCALGNHQTVGVDIEHMKPIKRLESMMERCFSAREQQQIRSASRPFQSFLQYWTCKEAYLKAIGMGLTQSMQTIEIQLTPPRLVAVPYACPEGWHLTVLSLSSYYVGALVTADEARVDLHHWKHTLASSV